MLTKDEQTLGNDPMNQDGQSNNVILTEKEQKIQTINNTRAFLENLQGAKGIREELQELKKIQLQKAHLLAQKKLANVFTSLKSVSNLLKKVQPDAKGTLPINPLIECIRAYKSIEVKYKEILDSVPKDSHQSPEELRNSEKLKEAVNDIKFIHTNVHGQTRESLKINVGKLLDSLDLPVKKNIDEVSINDEDLRKLKVVLTRVVEFDTLEKKLDEELDLETSQIDLASQIYLKKLFKSIDYHFLSKTELNVVDRPDWMVKYIEEALFANISFIIGLNFDENTLNYLVSSFLNAFYSKLQQRFQQDSSFFLEHEFLFTNFLVGLKEHENKVFKFLRDKNVEPENKEVYDLSRIYQSKNEYLERMIAGELKEFEGLVFETIDQMEIVTRDIPGKQRFDLALAEVVQNFVLVYNKNLEKYNATSKEYLSKFVKENMLDKAVKSLVKTLRRVIEDTESAAIGPYSNFR